MKINLRTVFLIAGTQMLNRKRQTIISTLGVTFGLSMFILMISFMTGVNDTLEDLALSNSPHIHIFNELKSTEHSIVERAQPEKNRLIILHHQRPKKDKQNLRNGLQIVSTILTDPKVLGATPNVNTQVFFNYGSLNVTGTIRGVDIFQEDKLFNLSKKIKQGRLEDLAVTQNGILIGVGLARKLSLKKGDKIYVTTPQGVQLLMKVVGLFQYGIGAVDDATSYATLGTVQKILGKDKAYITDISIKLKDSRLAASMAETMRHKYSYKVEDFETANATILVGNVIRNTLTFVVSFTLLVVAGFGIYNIMNMTIYEKIKDIAILKAMGFSGQDVTTIFLSQALFIGVMGGISGTLIGFLLSISLSYVPFPAGSIIAIDYFPVNFNALHYGMGLLFGIVTTALAGFFPSRKASRVDPVAIIRG